MDDTSRGDNSFATIVSGLTSLVQHVQAGIKLIDNVVAGRGPALTLKRTTSSCWTTSRRNT